jgi:dihydroorotate dehydrogenase electron transfer subunit
MIRENARVLWNTIECSGYFRLGLESQEGYASAMPGQFIMLRLPDRMAPLLRRPFSIHRLIETDGRVQGLEILYKVVGITTERLSVCREGDVLDMLGPLGNHFVIPPHARRFFIAAGGIGVAPMYFLTQTLGKQGADLSQCVIFIGGRSKDDLLCVDDFFSAGVTSLSIATDDGSAGEMDRVTGPLERAVRDQLPDIIYACGPSPMLKAVIQIAGRHGIPCQVSVETMMACGLGACLGCVVEKAGETGKYFHACIDGPVFDGAIINI